jgi:hypothetical protein
MQFMVWMSFEAVEFLSSSNIKQSIYEKIKAVAHLA